MDLATSLGLAAGVGVISLVILMGGDLHMFVSEHAAILIFGGCFAATLIRFPFAAIMHGMPLGMKFAFTSADLICDSLGVAAEPGKTVCTHKATTSM